MLAELSVAELAAWQAYYQVEPFGGDWHRTALLASILANANRDADKQAEPFGVEDFLPGRFAPAVDDVEDETEPEPAPWMLWKAAFGAMVETGG